MAQFFFFFFFFEMKEGCKVSRVKSIAWLLTNAKKGTTTLNFYIFKYGAEWSAEFGAKEQSIVTMCLK